MVAHDVVLDVTHTMSWMVLGPSYNDGQRSCIDMMCVMNVT